MAFSPMMASAALLVALNGVGAAHAEPPPFSFGPKPGWSLMGGLNSGGSFGSPGAGVLVGGELSLNRLSGGAWLGLYTDALYDTGQDRVWLSAGPQLGLGVLGLDGGIAARLADGVSSLGATARLILTTGLISLYGRYGYFPDAQDHIGQVGIMLKLPLWAAVTGEVQ